MQLQQEETVKRAVPVEVIKQMAALDLEEEPEKKLAVDMALFSFLACGMPFADIVRLGGENLVEEGKVLSCRRQKNRCTDRDGSFGAYAVTD